MQVISRETLKEKLYRGDDFKLVMVLDGYAYDRVRIPGSLHFNNATEAMKHLRPDEEIVVYCSNSYSFASIKAYLELRSHGYEKVCRYAGGLADWQAAGYPLEGTMVHEFTSAYSMA